MDRVNYHFPQKIDFERRYGYSGDLRYLVKVMASMYGKGGRMEFDTAGPNVRTHPLDVKARRDIVVDITDNKVDFLALNEKNTAQVMPSIPQKGTVDFKVTVRYTYIDKNFDKMSLIDDIFMVRTKLNGELLIQITSIHGQGRTTPEEVAETIETMMEHYKG
jgi:hypothetical protein